MNDFRCHDFTSRRYSPEETYVFSCEDDPKLYRDVRERHIQCCDMTQEQFDSFISNYADCCESIYFFKNPKVKDLSALSKLRNVEYILFFYMRCAESLWDMSENRSLKGIFLSNSKKMSYDLSLLETAPALEEFLLFSSMDKKYTVSSLDPLKRCKSLKRLILECNTENRDFDPADLAYLDLYKYRVDRKRNWTWKIDMAENN